MDQVKIGKFIKDKRKDKKITQDELAEKLGVTNRAISKWENGNCMPDSGIILDLCKILGITINDLFHGKVVDKKDEEKEVEKYLLKIYKQKEETDKKLLNFEIIVGVISLIYAFFVLIVSAYFLEYEVFSEIGVILLVVFSLVYILAMCIILLRIEQIAGYYECRKCNHRYVPSFKSVFLARHINRTRYMKCPKCGKWSWSKKVVGRDSDD